MEQTNFEQMLDALAQGDRTAFQQFYDQYGLPVYRYLLDKTGDTARTRRLWKDVFRTLMDRMRAEPKPDLPLLLLTALADLQLDADSGRESVETQAERLSTEWVDELSTADAPVESPEPPAAPVESPEPPAAPTPEADTIQWPDLSAAAMPYEASVPSEPEADAPRADEPPSDAPSADGAKPTHRRGWVALLIVLIVIGVAALWIGAGFAMTGGILPYFDLGYSWFNRVIFPLFPLT